MDKIRGPPEKKENLEGILKAGWQDRKTRDGYFISGLTWLATGVLYIAKEYGYANLMKTVGEITLLVAFGYHYVSGLSKNKY